MAGKAHDAAHALRHHVVGGAARQRPGLPEARAGGVDQFRIAPGERLPSIAEPRQRAGPEILDENVGAGEKPLEQGAVIVRPEVEGDALLAAVERHEIGGFAVHPRPVGARVVAAGRLDLDHPRAEVRQDHGAERPRQHAGQVEHKDIRERAGARGRPGSRIPVAHTGVPFRRAGCYVAGRSAVKRRAGAVLVMAIASRPRGSAARAAAALRQVPGLRRTRAESAARGLEKVLAG